MVLVCTGARTRFQQATGGCGRVHNWMGFFEDFLECLREKYPFLSPPAHEREEGVARPAPRTGWEKPPSPQWKVRLVLGRER